MNVTIQLVKPVKQRIISYPAELLSDDGDELVIRAIWDKGTLPLGYMTFENDDVFVEYYYRKRWYSIDAISSADGTFKGWYCNVTRPAVFDGTVITSEDLEIDLFVSPNRTTILTLDMDEFEARGFDTSDPATYQAALAALAELERMARTGEAPFDRT